MSFRQMVEKRDIYFNEELHKYTDQLGNVYTSTTTLIGKYAEKFDTKKMARICEKSGRNGNPKYHGKDSNTLIKEWKDITDTACEQGKERHNYLEDIIKSTSGYKKSHNADNTSNVIKMFTIDDILIDHNFGLISLDHFVETGIKEKYKQIFKLLEYHTNLGFKMYAEIGVYDTKNLISGMIDLLLVKDNSFKIIDWKTNKAEIVFKSGYFKKDMFGNITDEFLHTNKNLMYPLSHLEDSVGNKYTLQLSMYDYLVELHGLNCLGNILCHITKSTYSQYDPEVLKDADLLDKEKVKFLNIKYLKKDIENLILDHSKKLKLNSQTKLSYE